LVKDFNNNFNTFFDFMRSPGFEQKQSTTAEVRSGLISQFIKIPGLLVEHGLIHAEGSAYVSNNDKITYLRAAPGPSKQVFF